MSHQVNSVINQRKEIMNEMTRIEQEHIKGAFEAKIEPVEIKRIVSDPYYQLMINSLYAEGERADRQMIVGKDIVELE